MHLVEVPQRYESWLSQNAENLEPHWRRAAIFAIFGQIGSQILRILALEGLTSSEGLQRDVSKVKIYRKLIEVL